MNKQSLASQSPGKYELTIVLDGKTTVAKGKKIEETIAEIVEISKGKLGKVENWGLINTGLYLHFPLELEKSAVKNISTKLNQEGEIKRHLLVRKE